MYLPYRRLFIMLLLALSLVAASLAPPVPPPPFLRTWGWGVRNGTAEFQICTGNCQTGIQGSGDGQFDFSSFAIADVAVDSAGNIYVADYDNHRIQKFHHSGTFLAKWGTNGSGDGQFDNPRRVAVDSAGNVYVADSGNHRIQKFDSNGTFLATWGTNGSGDGQFTLPSGVAVDAMGNVYVAGTINSRIQKFGPGPPLKSFIAEPERPSSH